MLPVVVFTNFSSNSPPHKVLQHGRLSRALSTDHRYLGQVDGAVLTQLGEGILKLVDDEDQLLHPRVVERHLVSSFLACADLGWFYTIPDIRDGIPILYTEKPSFYVAICK